MKINLLCTNAEVGVYDLNVGKTYVAYFNDDYGYYELSDEGFSYELSEVGVAPLTFCCKSFSGGLVTFIKVN
ncbi:tailspike sialidase [Escherichia phage vB_EcoS-BECP10]|uniref:Tailspike sialidase n=1 Tax=Escherichia phage vB_EcoS-BECP10 TaxID=2797407 RepID=A0A7T7K8A4_9CAUD|nr:tailspike sialidase [Escherichia phage vB_EcoS-BECP10]